MTLIDRIEQEMLTDSEDRNRQSQLLKAEYNKAPGVAKEALDNAFICLCGYSLKTLLSDK